MSNDIAFFPVAGALGAEVRGIDLSRGSDGPSIARLRDGLMRHKVLFFRDQELSPDQHVAFARCFGEIDLNPFVRPLEITTLEGHPEVLNVVKEAADTGINFGGIWHADVTHRERPNFGSALLCRQAPTHGGDTMWANQVLAYETLSDGMKRMLSGLQAVHGTIRALDNGQVASVYGVAQGKVDYDKVRRSEAASEQVENLHPVVRTHESGAKCLFVNRSYTQRFEGWTKDESRPLLEYLYAHSIRPEFTVRWRWRAGDLALWDNRSTLHYALNDYHGQRREMHRVAIHGERPV